MCEKYKYAVDPDDVISKMVAEFIQRVDKADEATGGPSEEPEGEKVDMSIEDYRAYLENASAFHERKMTEADQMIGALDRALESGKLLVRCYQAADGTVIMITRPKGHLGFATPSLEAEEIKCK